jgi:2-keto-3-deoxy-L-rhamnonate aldolase RhmA
MNSIKRKLREGQIVVGVTIAELLRPSVIKIYANAGADFLYIENEHTMFNPDAFADAVICARDNGLPVVTKTPYLDRGATVKLLDAGVEGLQLPMTERAEDVLTFHRWLKYPPVGVRAICCGYASSNYQPVDLESFLKQQNEDTMLIAHVETRQGVEAIDDILGTGVVDIVFIGQDDLSVTVGRPGDHHDPRHLAAVKRVADAARRHHVFFGLFAPGIESAKRWIDEGAQFFEISDELMFIQKGATEIVKEFRELGGK